MTNEVAVTKRNAGISDDELLCVWNLSGGLKNSVKNLTLRLSR